MKHSWGGSHAPVIRTRAAAKQSQMRRARGKQKEYGLVKTSKRIGTEPQLERLQLDSNGKSESVRLNEGSRPRVPRLFKDAGSCSGL